MANFFTKSTRLFSRSSILGMMACALLAGCSSGGNSVAPNPFGTDSTRSDITTVPTTAVEQAPLDNLGGGTPGLAKVMLILPLSATGNAGKTAQSMQNAAEMAVAELQSPAFELITLDDKGTQAGAAEAATQAIAQGANLILGPLFAPSVVAAGQVAKTKGVPVIAYSTDQNAASQGVYLLSFLPNSDVNRVVNYAAQNGKRRFVGLIPESSYGTVVESAFRQAVASAGGTVVAIERYPLDKTKLQEPIRRAAVSAKEADAIFMPDASETAPLIADALRANGVDLSTVQLLGTGLWDDPKISNNRNFANGIYAAPEPAAWDSFKTRYRARYNSEPVRIASLAYDSVRLVAALAKNGGISTNVGLITNANGFSGIDGVFRFNPDGTNERGLAVLAVGGKVLSPAAKSFAGGN